ncbi:MAG: ATP-binding protein [Lachnospiraceae bacterium]
MEFYEENIARQKGIERLNLIMYSMYVLNLGFCSVKESWPFWILLIVVILNISLWVIYIKQYKTYPIRALLDTICMGFTMLIYGLYTSDFWSSFTAFYVIVILIGLYGISEYLYATIIVAIVLFINYAVKTHILNDEEASRNFTIQIVNVFLFIMLVYTWVKNRVRAMIQTSKTIEALKLVERSKDDFLANVSHEIRTPLNTISGMSEIALGEQDVNTIHEYMYSIQTASRNLMSTVSDILDFSELQAGEISLNEEDYSVTSTINDIVNMSMALREDKDIEIIVDFDTSIPRVLFGDEKKIRRVVMNLVSNAIKFTKDGGVCICVKGRREQYGLNLAIVVKDTGIGMNAENLERLYTSFGQLDTRRNRQNGGIGLGLAISKALVDSMGGTLLINSEYGKGSTVQVVVPQKIVDDVPSVSVRNKDHINALIYLDMEKFKLREIRDAYTENMEHMIAGLGITAHSCRSLMELKRRISREKYTVLIISASEYQQDPAYFEGLDNDIQMIVILDRDEDKNITDSRVHKVYKPFSVFSFVSVLNEMNRDLIENQTGKMGHFIAPTAKILVVDDNYMNIRVLQGLLKKYKIAIDYALCGAEALEMIENMDYDFVFMDHMMPEMDGVETAHRIRNKIGTYYQNVPIIALTANAIAGTREMFMEEGFADFVEKPVELSVLERVLKRNLPEQKLIYEGDYDKTISVPELDEDMESDIESDTELNNPSGSDTQESLFHIAKLDVETGKLYCGGMDGYVNILCEFCESARDDRMELMSLYEQQNWDDYVIKVHALKSCMKTIGAMSLSDAALELELAGKNQNYHLIVEKHGALMKQHRDLFRTISGNPYLRTRLSEEAVERNLSDDIPVEVKRDVELKALSDDEFKAFVEAFESLVYQLDGEQLSVMAEQLENCSYHDVDLSEVLKKIRKKITQEDYFSALEMLKGI